MQKNGYTFATVYNSKCVSVFLHQTIVEIETVVVIILFLSWIEVERCNNRRNIGIGTDPEGLLSELISGLQKAECSVVDTSVCCKTLVCCATKFKLLADSKVMQNISALENELFMAEESDKNVAENSSLVIAHSNILLFAFIVGTISIK